MVAEREGGGMTGNSTESSEKKGEGKLGGRNLEMHHISIESNGRKGGAHHTWNKKSAYY